MLLLAPVTLYLLIGLYAGILDRRNVRRLARANTLNLCRECQRQRMEWDDFYSRNPTSFHALGTALTFFFMVIRWPIEARELAAVDGHARMKRCADKDGGWGEWAV